MHGIVPKGEFFAVGATQLTCRGRASDGSVWFGFNSQPRRITRPGASSSDVLIDENRVSVGVHRDKTGGARRALVCLVHHLHALRLQLAL
jgi:hypothetical protein